MPTLETETSNEREYLCSLRHDTSVRPDAKGVVGQICATSMAHFHFEVTDDDDVDLGEGREQRGRLPAAIHRMYSDK